MISKVYIWQNRMVMVFDENGQQIPEYQGTVDEVMDKIRKDAPEKAQFFGGSWKDNEIWKVRP